MLAAGRIVIQLYKSVAPRTTENFRCLCTGEKVGSNGLPLTYKGTEFHKGKLPQSTSLVPNLIIQGGDIHSSNGSGGESIYGKTFPDEDFSVKHDLPGRVSMANSGPHTNGSQFFFTLRQSPHLDGKYVAFGQVVAGLDVLFHVQNAKTDEDGHPIKGDGVKKAVEGIKKAGNSFFQKKDYLKADEKYKKALRYIDKFEENIPLGRKASPLSDDRISCLLNHGACCLHIQKYNLVIAACSEVLQLEPGNTKALYRRAKAFHAIQEYEKSIVDLQKAMRAGNQTSELGNLLKAVRRDYSQHQANMSKKFAKMFQPSSP
ncbi:unnamed protein product [Darwinula stevensoni]|uniref:peptidylprolyl isomerase n=1 Tax=Darwinula stevensoni TaxID=69355 RepID=A0A7R9A4L9_9CRUS|nr:unnamed protein product [Darwinula stevensoni]CAG0883674.1 unnamed protein product [Darwinula stevensoni]